MTKQRYLAALGPCVKFYECEEIAFALLDGNVNWQLNKFVVLLNICRHFVVVSCAL